MNLRDLVKSHFNLVDAPVEEPTPNKFGEIKTADGEITLTYDGEELTVGTPVFVRTEADGDIPAPDGEHALEGGIKIITVGGVVSEIMETAEASEDEVVAVVDMAAETEESVATDNVELAEDKDMEEYPKREEIAETIAEIIVPLMEEMRKDLEEMKAKFSKMDEKVEKFGALPAAKRAKEEIYAKRNPQKSNNDFRNDEQKKVFERIMKRKNK